MKASSISGRPCSAAAPENFRLDDTLYRMCKSYGFKRYDVFVIPSNIQITVETPEGEFLTQIRHIASAGINYDRLDYLNNLARYVCRHTPDEETLREKYLEVMNRKQQPVALTYAAGIMGGTGFAVFFGCGLTDAVVAVLVSLLIVFVGRVLDKVEDNLLVYNLLLAFLSEVVIIGMAALGHRHPSGPDHDRHRHAADQCAEHDQRHTGGAAAGISSRGLSIS